MSCNVPYERFLRQQAEARHQRNLQTMRGLVDSQVPKTANAKTFRQGKRLRLQADREEGIKRENNVLLRKMLTIDLKPSALHPYRLFAKSSSVGTLNRGARLRSISEINAANKVLHTQNIYERLKGTASVYSIRKWERDNVRHEYLTQNLSRNSGHLELSPLFSRPQTVGERRYLSTRGSSRPKTEGRLKGSGPL